MYLHETIQSAERETINRLRRALRLPFADEQLARATRMEVWCTNFSDPGPDIDEFRLVDERGREIARHCREY